MSEKLISKKYKLNSKIMEKCLTLKKSKFLKSFKKGKKIKVSNRMQKNYSYVLIYNCGKKLREGGVDENGDLIKYPDFKPKYSPGQMLNMGVFEGKYCNDQIFEFPREWYFSSVKNGKFNEKKFSPEYADSKCNYFGVKSRQSLQEWRRKGWIPCAVGDKDTRGWFEWFCRYWLGRRQPNVDSVQIKRWKSFKRHYAQYLKHTKGAPGKHPKRRQALLQWSYPCKE
jgi:hypothetical protein